jgi:hypothetical protein
MPDNQMVMRVATLRSSTADDEARTVDVVLATEAPIVTDGFSGREYIEILRMDGFKIPDQLPLLNRHNHYDAREVLGSFRNLRLEGDKFVGTMHVSSAETDLWTKVVEGHLRDLSIGALPRKSTVLQAGESRTVKGRPYTARAGQTVTVITRWEALEGSLTWRGADPRTKTRTYPEDRMMKKELRTYLESQGLDADADDTVARTFHDELDGEVRTRADELAGGKPEKKPPAADEKDPPPVEPVQRTAPPGDRTFSAADLRREIERSDRQPCHGGGLGPADNQPGVRQSDPRRT